MSRLFNKFQFFYSPDDAPGPDNTPSGGNKEDDIKFLGLDESDDSNEAEDLLKNDKTPIKPKKEEKKDDKDEDKEDDEDKDEDDENDELEDLVEELEDPTDEQLELVTPVRRREILNKYPTLFKDFPYLEKAYYREQQFTEIFPTIPEAKEAVEKSATLDKFESDLMGGNTETILKVVREQDPNSFAKIVDDYLPTLARVDEKAYHHVLGNVSKHTIMAMVNEGRRSQNDTLLSAAQILNQFVFGTSDFVAPTQLATDQPKDDPNANKLDQERQQFTRERFESTRGDLNTKLNNSLKSTIEANIDPRSSMTSYVKNNAIRDANEELGKMISSDKRFTLIIDKLWENAFKQNFNKESTDKIRSAYLSKAKTLLPSVIKKARMEALKGMGKKVRDTDNDDSDESPTIKKSSSRSDKSDNKSSGVPKGMRTIDFLMQD